MVATVPLVSSRIIFGSRSRFHRVPVINNPSRYISPESTGRFVWLLTTVTSPSTLAIIKAPLLISLDRKTIGLRRLRRMLN